MLSDIHNSATVTDATKIPDTLSDQIAALLKAHAQLINRYEKLSISGRHIEATEALAEHYSELLKASPEPFIVAIKFL